MRYFILMFTFVCSFVAAQPTIVPQLQQQVTDLTSSGNDSNLLIVFYVQIMPDDFVMQFHRF
ncbi:hypothetical protein C5097_19030 [Escherichia coli]|nr:hypothetical protein C5097_19030 [Escherichia coli]